MSTFDYRMNRRQQLIKRGEPMDNNIDFSGKTNTDFLNTFVAKMKDTNNLYNRESPGQFTDPEADIVRKNLIVQADGLGEFNDQATAFMKQNPKATPEQLWKSLGKLEEGTMIKYKDPETGEHTYISSVGEGLLPAGGPTIITKKS